MLHAQMTYFDLIVIGVMALSCIFAFFRGFVKEVLSLGAWLAAGLVTVYYFQDVAKWMEPHFKGKQMVAGGIAALGLYITCLVAFSLLNSLIMRFLREGSDVGFLDNTLGLLFGAFRGAFIVSLGYLLMSMVVATEGDAAPNWLTSSYTKPYAEHGAKLLAHAAPGYLREHSDLMKQIAKKEDITPEEDVDMDDSSVSALQKKATEHADGSTDQRSPASFDKLIKTLKRKETP